MHKFKTLIFTIELLLILNNKAFAYTFEQLDTQQTIKLSESNASENGIFFSLNNKENTASAIKYTGENSTVELPAKVKKNNKIYKVVTPKLIALEGGKYLNLDTGVHFSLNKTNLQASVTGYESNIDPHVFIPQQVEFDEVKYNVTAIGKSAFKYCSNLDLKTLSSGITKIGNYAFLGCDNLKLKKLPDSIKIIGAWAFYNCKNLNLSELPTAVKKIGNAAFYGCKNLNLTKIPDGSLVIAPYAFKETNIDNITLPASIKRLGFSSFETSKLKTISVDRDSHLSYNIIKNAFGKYKNQVEINIEENENKIIAFKNIKTSEAADNEWSKDEKEDDNGIKNNKFSRINHKKSNINKANSIFDDDKFFEEFDDFSNE